VVSFVTLVIKIIIYRAAESNFNALTVATWPKIAEVVQAQNALNAKTDISGGYLTAKKVGYE
jgi:hypothetical protein